MQRKDERDWKCKKPYIRDDVGYRDGLPKFQRVDLANGIHGLVPQALYWNTLQTGRYDLLYLECAMYVIIRSHTIPIPQIVIITAVTMIGMRL